MVKTIRSILVFICLVWVLCLPVFAEKHGGKPGYCRNAVGLTGPEDLDLLLNLCAGSKLVLLGESTHGTADFYRWRAEISKRLIAEEGFNFIVVEGDWASLYRLNLYVKGLMEETATARDVLKTFNRWPEWMWGNTEVEQLAEWLREFNADRPLDQRAGLYGMDVYGHWEAMEEVLSVASAKFPEILPDIQSRFDCYTEYDFDEWRYAKAVRQGHPACYEQLGWVFDAIREHLESLSDPRDRKALTHAKQSARVVQNSEEYYRFAVRDNVISWNIRVDHMHETVTRLLAFHGDDSRGIVWAHNTHIGDARATAMRKQGLRNIGELSRETHGSDSTTLIGFTTYKGKVNAGARWGAPMSRMQIPEAMEGSAESLLKKCGIDNFFTIFDDEIRQSRDLLQPIGHRAIGVIFNPSTERIHNYVPTILPQRYDAIVFLKSTNPLDPVAAF